MSTNRNSAAHDDIESSSSMFVDVAEGPRHSLGVTADGSVYSWGNSRSSNNLGQLGRDTPTTGKKKKQAIMTPGRVQPFAANGSTEHDWKATKVFVSHSLQKDSGHSAILDSTGTLWMSGCDRWQQLGLGSANGGAAGYTWKGGKLWQDRFVRSESITNELSKQKQNHTIRDVALGGDHTLVLSSNQTDVYAFGKCGDGQCGFIGKPYVSAPKRSKLLSSSGGDSETLIAAVCAIESCSITIDEDGKPIQKVGKCTPPPKVSGSTMSSTVLSPSALAKGIEACLRKARRRGLINNS